MLAGLLVYLVVLVFYSFDAYDRARVQTIINYAAAAASTRAPTRSSPFSVVSSGADVDRR